VARPDRLERLTDLVLVLLRAGRPLTLDAIANEVPGYPAEHDARRQAFERDKRLLRDDGIPVSTEVLEGQEQFGYRIHPDAFYLPDLHLQPDEQAALHLAVAGVHLGDPSGRNALLKLGASGVAEARPVASLVPPPALVPLFDALRTRAEVTFSYRGQGRRVAPAGLWFRSGRWYLAGWDHDRHGGRTFRVDRIEGRPASGPADSGAVPEGFDPAEAAPDDPWRAGEGDEGEVQLWVDGVEAPRVVEEVGERAVVERRRDGSVVLTLGVSSSDAFRSWVLGLLDHAEVIGPPPRRSAVVDWLERTAALTALPARAPGAAPVLAAAAGALAGPPAADRQAPVSPPRPGARKDASDRLRRLLAIVGWLARVGEAPITEISRRFGVPESELVHELELAACCGVPPYSPDALMEIVVTDTMVSALLPDDLARPRRLTAAEGFALLAAGRTILAVPGADESGSLDRALGKLEAVLGDHGRVEVALDAPLLLPEVRRVAEEGRQVAIEYHSASADETTHRTVDPIEVVALDGHWYLDAFCHSAGGSRRFRIDRIRSMVPTGAAVGPDRRAPGGAGAGPFVPGPGALAVTLALDPEASWVVDSVPVVGVREVEGGGHEVTLAVGGTAWLERLLLQLGPHARVLDPPNLADLGPGAATRLLARYRPPS
jgi:proteasome accessory factor C